MGQLTEDVWGSALEMLDDLNFAVGSSDPGGEVIFAHVAGSHLYGMAHDDSDIDVRGIHLARTVGLFHMDPIFGSRSSASTVSLGGDDAQSHEIGKFCHLACSGNPQVLEMLFVPQWSILTESLDYSRLRRVRDAFLSQRVPAAYLGYTLSNLSQAMNHIFRAIEIRDEALTSDLLIDSRCTSIDVLLGRLDSFQKMGLLVRHRVGWDVAVETRAQKAAAHVIRLLSCLEHFMDHGEFSVDLGDDLDLAVGVRLGEVPFNVFAYDVLDRHTKIEAAISSPLGLREHPDVHRINCELVQIRKDEIRDDL
jgi:hypothetical protein